MTKMISLYTCFRCFLLILFCTGLFIDQSYGQSPAPNDASKKPSTGPSPAILAHYTPADLADIQATDSLKYKTIFYYYKESFILQPFDCQDCVNLERMRDFDVSNYEEFRQQSQRYTRVFDKYGFKITLLSIDELTYKLPIHQNP